MNSITIAGLLGRDAESKYLPNGDAVLNFSVADDQGKGKETVWWACQLWGKRAESLAPYLTKGQAVTVTGSVSQRKWTDKSGDERTTMEVRVNDVALQGGRRSAEQDEAPAPRRAAPAAPTVSDDDIPF